ncbi:MAG: alpha/beta hydrolase [Methyloligellaceae bacterium]
MLLFRDGFSPASLKSIYSVLVAEGGVEADRSVGYGPHARHQLDVYRPERGAGDGPIVLFLYGGGWRNGHRSTYGFVGAALASRGITTVIPDYRLYPEVRFPAFVEDAALAYRWVVRNVARAGEGTRPVILVGHSAGAHTAALLALDRRYLEGGEGDIARPAGLIGLAGPYAFDPTTWATTKSIFAGTAKADAARPISFASKDAPPALLMHGLDDTVVRLWNMQSLTRDLRQAGARVRSLEFDGIGHIGLVLAISRPFRWRAPVLQETLSFIRDVAGSSD